MLRAIAICITMTGCLANSLLLWPPKPTAAALDARREMIGEVEVLVATTQPGVAPAGYVLRFYGNAQVAQDSIAYDAAMLAEVPLEIWGVNYPGYGGSAHQATLRGVARSARATYAALAARVHGRPIIVMGTSLGTTAALHLAAHERVAGVVLHNPPPLRQLIRGRYGWWNLWLLALPVAAAVPRELDSLANARRASAPAVFLSSTDDGVVPVRYQRRIAAAYAGRAEVLELRGAGHNDPIPAWARERLVAALAGWVSASSASSPAK